MPPLEEMRNLADELVQLLSPGCVRIQVAGSILRQKPEPKDIEVVCISSTGVYTMRDLFGSVIETIPVNHLNDEIAISMPGKWDFDTETPRNGEHYKRLHHLATGICADVFITDARKWGYTLAVRTGPGEFSTALVTRAHHLRMFFSQCLLHNHPPARDGKGKVLACPMGDRCPQIIETPEESDVFAALQLRHIPPQQRASIHDLRDIAL